MASHRSRGARAGTRRQVAAIFSNSALRAESWAYAAIFAANTEGGAEKFQRYRTILVQVRLVQMSGGNKQTSEGRK